MARSAALARLTRRSEFLRVAAARRKFVTEGAVVQAAARPIVHGDDGGPAETGARVGFTATRTVGSAVVRNRARRRLKEAVRAAADAAAAGVDYVVIARAGTLRRPFADLVGDVRTAFAALARAGRREAKEASRNVETRR